jgi:hypothetical protein
LNVRAYDSSIPAFHDSNDGGHIRVQHILTLFKTQKNMERLNGNIGLILPFVEKYLNS